MVYHRRGLQADSHSVVHSDPDTLGGMPVFRGTRVRLRTLFDYLEGGETLEQFLDQFPSVSRVQAIAALEIGDRSAAGYPTRLAKSR